MYTPAHILAAVAGTAAFVLFFMYDINSFCRQYKIPQVFFALGFALLAAAAGADIYGAAKNGAISGIWDTVLLTGAAIWLAALIYCLFFALPFANTYTEQTADRGVCDTGVYALCRHPGILCFFGLFLFLGLAALPSPALINGMWFSALNLIYAAFQDKVTFPKTLGNYADYQKKVPFIIPTKASIHTAFKTLARPCGKEDNT